MFLGNGFHPGDARALQIGPIVLPDTNPPVTIDQGTPTIVKTPSWAPQLSAANGDVVIMIPGTTDYDGSDQTGRTLGIGLFGGVVGEGTDSAHVDTAVAPPVTIVDYPAAFGLDPFGFLIYLAGTDTFSHSVQVGTVNGVTDAIAAYDPQNPGQKVVINGYSQSAPIAMNVAYLLHRNGSIPDDNVIVIVGADSRFPNTGVENVVPSFLPGMYTNGDRDASGTGDIAVYSYCVRGDATCGVGNPLVNPVSTFFYLVPGFYVHAFLNSRINEYEISDTWTDGNTTYIVYDGGNPWGMMLRDMGFWVPEEFDDALSAAIPVPMPGHQSTLADLRIPMTDEMRETLSGYEVPTPRELQELIYGRLGLDVPVHDPDACAATPSACQVDYGDLLTSDSTETGASSPSARRVIADDAAEHEDSTTGSVETDTPEQTDPEPTEDAESTGDAESTEDADAANPVTPSTTVTAPVTGTDAETDAETVTRTDAQPDTTTSQPEN